MKQEIENPLQLIYIRQLTLLLGFVGGIPYKALDIKENLLIKFNRISTFIGTIIYIQAEIYYLHNYHGMISFIDEGLVFITMLLAVLTFSRIVLLNLKKYGNIVKVFFKEFHLINFRKKGDHHLQEYYRIEKISKIYMLTALIFVYSACILFNIAPIYHNYQRGYFSGELPENATLQLAAYQQYPGLDPHDNDDYWILTFINWYSCYLCTSALCGTDLLLIVIVFNTIGHLSILAKDLEKIPKPNNGNSITFNHNNQVYKVECKMYDKEENALVSKLLSDCIAYHRFIVSFMAEVAELFGPLLGLSYNFDFVMCCLLLLECSQGDPEAVFRFGPLMIIRFVQIIQISVMFELLNSLSEKLKDKVYDISWEYMDTKNRRTVCIFLHRVQDPIQVKAMGVVPVGVLTMLSILKGIFSYYMFLKTIV